MSTKLQKDANRENAKKSTGPKTPGGKAKSAQNATTHGLTAHYEVITTEDQQEYDFFRKEMIDHLNPIDPMQYRLADRIVSLSWRLKRAEIMHDRTIEDLLFKDRPDLYDDMEDYPVEPDTPCEELALGHMAAYDFSKRRAVLDRLIMYERRIENSLYKTIKELKNLKKENMKNEPNFESSASSPTYPHGSRVTSHGPPPTSHEPRFIQNEPNFTPHASKNPINHSRPKVESTNNQSSIINVKPQ